MTETERWVCDQCGTSTGTPSRYCPACGSEIVTFKPGEVLDGKYEILGKVGEGGMGEVYRARHLHLDEIRIIKVMKLLASDDASQQRRFSEEARLATQVRHPNVAALYDFSKLPSGSYYMVWEFIDGETLLHRLRRGGRLSPDEAIEIGIQVLSGLGEIHRTGVVHRDVSPDNIMIIERGGRRVAKIIDLGIAKKMTEDRFGMTATGMFLGKLKYCSPEQAGALPIGEKLDGRSDLYSFGAVLYEMLSGKPLFESPTPEGYIVKHLQEAPPALDRADLPPEIRVRLSEIVGRALRKDRNRRFQSAEEFSAALAALRRVTSTMPTVRAATDHDPTEPLTTPAAGTTVVRPRSRAVRRTIRAATFSCVLLGAVAAGYAIWKTQAGKSLPISRLRPPETPRAAPGAAAATSPTPLPSRPPTASEEEARIVETPATFTGTAAVADKAPAKRFPQASPPRPPRPPREPVPPDESAAIARFAELRKAAAKGGQRQIDAIVDFVRDYTLLNPRSPFSTTLKTELPGQLKSKAREAEESGHPWKALRLYELYVGLPFSPSDPEVETRVRDLNARLQPAENSGKAGSGALEQEPIRFSRARTSLSIRVRWPSRPPEVAGALFYRSRASRGWIELPLQADGDTLEATIPAEHVVPPFLAYYVEARDARGTLRTVASRAQPVLVRIGRR